MNTTDYTLGNFENKNQKANVGIRILAAIVDLIVFWLFAWVVAYFYGEPMDDEIGFKMTGLPAFVTMIVGLLLWPVSEGYSGQTLGKRIFGIKVVKDNLKPIGLGQAFARFFLGFIDCIFFCGIIVALANPKSKRIGDLAASTLVVKV